MSGTSNEVCNSTSLNTYDYPSPPGNSTRISQLHILRMGMYFLLGCLISGIGVISFTLLKSSETNNFSYIFESSIKQISITTKRKLNANLLAGEVARNLYTYLIKDDCIGTIPNITLPGYDAVMIPLSYLSSSRTISFSPIISTSTRHEWESYAKQHVNDLNGPSQLTTSTNGSWTVKDGIYARNTNGNKIKSPGYSPNSLYPDILTPLWQVTNISVNYLGIMYDTHSDKMRMIAIDQAISTKKSTYTDLVQLQIDTNLRPSTVLYEPIVSLQDINVKGIIAITLTWDNIFEDVLPSFVSGFYFVLSTSTQTYTYLLNNGNVQLVGSGDLHDPMYSSYGTPISLTDTLTATETTTNSLHYTLIIYPSKELYNQYNTNIPTIVSCSLVFGSVLIVLIYLIMNRQKLLLEKTVEAKRILAIATLVCIAKL
jgi:hypothetical protein